MSKGIVCMDKSCKLNWNNHCTCENRFGLLKLNENHICEWYVKDEKYSEKIKSAMSQPNQKRRKND